MSKEPDTDTLQMVSVLHVRGDGGEEDLAEALGDGSKAGGVPGRMKPLAKKGPRSRLKRQQKLKPISESFSMSC